MEFSLYGTLIIFLLSIAKATFWILIIFAVGFVVERMLKELIKFLTEEVKEKKPDEEE